MAASTVITAAGGAGGNSPNGNQGGGGPQNHGGAGAVGRVVMEDGEELQGWIEWYDKNCIKVHRNDGPNLLIFKNHIRYLIKDEDAAE